MLYDRVKNSGGQASREVANARGTKLPLQQTESFKRGFSKYLELIFILAVVIVCNTVSVMGLRAITLFCFG